MQVSLDYKPEGRPLTMDNDDCSNKQILAVATSILCATLILSSVLLLAHVIILPISTATAIASLGISTVALIKLLDFIFNSKPLENENLPNDEAGLYEVHSLQANQQEATGRIKV